MDDDDVHPPMYKARVVHIVDPHNFWVQLGTDDSFQQFNQFEYCLGAYCGEASKSSAHVDNLYESQVILAFSSTRLKWLRAQISRFNRERDNLDVLYLDYGTTEIVSMDMVCTEIPQAFLEFPPQVFRASLAGIVPIAKSWTNRGIACFKKLGLDSLFYALILSWDVTLKELSLYAIEDSEESNNLSISHLLIEDGVGKPSNIENVPGNLSEAKEEWRRQCDQQELKYDAADLDYSDESVETPNPQEESHAKMDDKMPHLPQLDTSLTYNEGTPGESRSQHLDNLVNSYVPPSPASIPPSPASIPPSPSSIPQSPGGIPSMCHSFLDVTQNITPEQMKQIKASEKKLEVLNETLEETDIPDMYKEARNEKWGEMSDLTIGKDIRWNGNDDIVESIASQVRQVSSTATAENRVDPKATEKWQSENLNMDNIKARLNPDDRLPSLEIDESRMGTRNTDPDTKPLKIEDKKPVQKIDESKDLAKIINDKKDIVQRPDSASPVAYDRDAPKAKTTFLTWTDKKTEESPMFSSNLSRIVNAMTAENYDEEKLELDKLMFPDGGLKISSDKLKELISFVVDKGIHYYNEFHQQAVKILESYHECEQFCVYLEEILKRKQDKYVKVSRRMGQYHTHYSMLLGYIYRCSTTWNDSECLHELALKSLQKWIYFKKNSEGAPDPLQHVFLTCFLAFCQVAGPKLKWSDKIEPIREAVKDKVLDDMTDRSTRVKMLDLLLELPSCQTTERLDTATQTEEVERNMPKEATVEENAAPAKKEAVSSLTSIICETKRISAYKSPSSDHLPFFVPQSPLHVPSSNEGLLKPEDFIVPRAPSSKLLNSANSLVHQDTVNPSLTEIVNRNSPFLSQSSSNTLLSEKTEGHWTAASECAFHKSRALLPSPSELRTENNTYETEPSPVGIRAKAFLTSVDYMKKGKMSENSEVYNAKGGDSIVEQDIFLPRYHHANTDAKQSSAIKCDASDSKGMEFKTNNRLASKTSFQESDPSSIISGTSSSIDERSPKITSDNLRQTKISKFYKKPTSRGVKSNDSEIIDASINTTPTRSRWDTLPVRDERSGGKTSKSFSDTVQHNESQSKDAKPPKELQEDSKTGGGVLPPPEVMYAPKPNYRAKSKFTVLGKVSKPDKHKQEMHAEILSTPISDESRNVPRVNVRKIDDLLRDWITPKDKDVKSETRKDNSDGSRVNGDAGADASNEFPALNHDELPKKKKWHMAPLKQKKGEKSSLCKSHEERDSIAQNDAVSDKILDAHTDFEFTIDDFEAMDSDDSYEPIPTGWNKIDVSTNQTHRKWTPLQNKCLLCGDSDHDSHNCPNKKTQFFLC